MGEGRRKNRPSHIPLTIDPLGGVSMAAGEGKDRKVNFSIRGEVKTGITREVDGCDWRVSFGEGRGRVEIQALGDEFGYGCLSPFMNLTYSRWSGVLTGMVISGVDLAVLAGTRMALEMGDRGNVEDLKLAGEDRLFGLGFSPDGLQMVTVDSVGREIVRGRVESEESLGLAEFGFLPGEPNYFWTGDMGFLKGRVGFEVFSDRVVLFYEKDGKDALVRLDVMEVPRTVGVAGLDGVAHQGIPSEDDLLKFMKQVYVPLI